MSWIVMPPTRETVFVKYLSMTSFEMPSASKDLAARVGLDRGNAHLGRDFDNARQHGLVV